MHEAIERHQNLMAHDTERLKRGFQIFETITRGMRIVVDHPERFVGTGGEQKIMPPDINGDDLQHYLTAVGVKHMACSQKQRIGVIQRTPA
jgi:hypothetical protein